jgi:hypothetical protein
MADTKISASTSTGYAGNLMIPVAIPSNTGAFHIPASVILAALTPAQILTLLTSISWGTTDPGGGVPWINGNGAANGPLWIGPA